MTDLTWIQTNSGRRFDINDITEDAVDIADIAHSLAHQARYNGHANTLYSVGEHSILIADWIERTTGDPLAAYAGLMHDASEAYLSDVPKPFKAMLGNYEELEHKVSTALSERFSFPYPYPAIVKEADARIVLDERVALFTTIRDDWKWPETEPLGVRIQGLSPEEAKRGFLQRYERLSSIVPNA